MRILLCLAILANLSSMASADYISADVDFGEHSVYRQTAFAIVYDPDELPLASNVFFESAGDHNQGIWARDSSPIGWVDPVTGQFDVTVDGIHGEISTGLGTGYRPNLWTDHVRLVNDGPDTYVSLNGRELEVDWSNIGSFVPEPSSLALLLVGLIFANHRRMKCRFHVAR